MQPPRGPKPTANPDYVHTLIKSTNMTFQDIAEWVGVSRQRVHQIAMSFGITGRQRRKAQQTKDTSEILRRREDEDDAIFDAWAETGKCDNIHASRAINRYLSVDGLRRCCVCNLPKHIEQFSKRGPQKHSNRCKKCTAKAKSVYYSAIRVKRSNAYIPPTGNKSQTGVKP